MDDRTALVVSSDFTHYGPNFGYVPFRTNVAENLRQLDGGAMEKILAGDPDGFAAYCEDTGATICGQDAIGVLLRMLPHPSGPASWPTTPPDAAPAISAIPSAMPPSRFIGTGRPGSRNLRRSKDSPPPTGRRCWPWRGRRSSMPSREGSRPRSRISE